jgi:hypothetical protein
MQPLYLIPHVDAGDAWAFDFIGPLSKTKNGNRYLLTAIDLGTDWTIAQAIPTKLSDAVVNMDILTQMLAQMTAPERQNTWDKCLPEALLAHCTHTSLSTGMSLFFLLYRREACLLDDRILEKFQRDPTDKEIGYLQQQQLEHVQDLAQFRTEANV